LACSIDEYCGVISPWGTPWPVFGVIPADIYWLPQLGERLFARWIAAETHDTFVDFVSREFCADDWPHSTQWLIGEPDLTLMDSCSFRGDDRFRLRLDLIPGVATVYSRYASDDANVCVASDSTRRVGPNVLPSQLVGRLLMEVTEFSDGSNVSIDGAFCHSGQTKILDELVVTFSLKKSNGFGRLF